MWVNVSVVYLNNYHLYNRDGAGMQPIAPNPYRRHSYWETLRTAVIRSLSACGHPPVPIEAECGVRSSPGAVPGDRVRAVL